MNSERELDAQVTQPSTRDVVPSEPKKPAETPSKDELTDEEIANVSGGAGHQPPPMQITPSH